MECFLCTPFSLSAQYFPLLCETSITGLHAQQTAVCFQRSILFASTFIGEFSCLLHVEKPEAPPVLADSRKYWDWTVTAVTWSLSNMERVQDQAGSSTCNPAQASSDRSHLCLWHCTPQALWASWEPAIAQLLCCFYTCWLNEEPQTAINLWPIIILQFLHCSWYQWDSAYETEPMIQHWETGQEGKAPVKGKL